MSEQINKLIIENNELKNKIIELKNTITIMQIFAPIEETVQIETKDATNKKKKNIGIRRLRRTFAPLITQNNYRE